jgi:hypothetical protein
MELKCQTYHFPQRREPPVPRVEPPVPRVIRPRRIPYVFVRQQQPNIYHGNVVMNRGFYSADALVNGNIYRIFLYCSQAGQRQCRVVNIRFLGQSQNHTRLPVTRLEYLGLDNSIIGNYLN